MLNLIKQIQLIDQQEMIQRYELIKRMFNRLSKRIDKAENWFDGEEQHDEEPTEEEDRDSADQCIEIITNLIEQVVIKTKVGKQKKQVSLLIDFTENLEQVEEEPVHTDLFFLNSYRIDPHIQKLLRNLSFHKVILELIQYDLTFYKDQQEIPPKSKTLIQFSYRFLQMFAYQDPTNQKLLENDLDYFLQHIKYNKEPYASLLLIELFRNNRSLLLNIEIIHKAIKELAKLLNQLQFSVPLKIYLFQNMQVFLKYKSAILKQNQTETLAIFGSTKYSNILFFFKDRSKIQLSDIQQFAGEYDNFLRNIDQTRLEIPKKIEYFANQQILLSLLTEDKNLATEQRCQTLMPLSTMAELLAHTKHCYYLRKYIVLFIYHVYLDTEKEFKDELSFIQQISEEIIADFIALAKVWNEQNKKTFQTTDSIRSYQEVKQGYLVIIMPCLLIIFKQFYEVKSTQQTFAQIKSILGAILALQSQIEDKYLRIYFSNIYHQMLKILSTLQIKTTEINDIETQFKENAQDDILRQQKRFLQEATNALTSVDYQYNQQTQEASNQEYTRDADLQDCIQRFENSQSCATFLEKEYKIFISNIMNIEEFTQRAFKGINTIQFEEICKGLMEIIEPKEKLSEMTLPQSLCATGLKIFRRLIEMQNKSELVDDNQCAASWETEEWIDYAPQIRQVQDKLVELGIAKLVVNSISYASVSREVKNEAILLGIALLLGGNEGSQRNFLAIISQDKKNTFLWMIQSILNQSFSLLKKEMDRINKIKDSRTIQFANNN